MASLLSKSNLFSLLRGNPQGFQEPQAPFPRRGFHVELGAREKALLEEDPALKKFKSHKKSLGRVKKFGDALIILVVAGCCYEIYVKGVEKREKFSKVNGTDST